MNNSTRDNPGPAGIILAAGMGRRMGKTKQLLLFQGKPVLVHVLEQGIAAGLDPLILVLGHRAKEIQNQLPDLPVDLVINTHYQSGMASSIVAGLERLEKIQNPPGPGALFVLGDQPLVRAPTMKTIICTALKRPEQIVVPVFKGKQGNPVWFDPCFFKDLKKLTGDTGGKALFKQFPEAMTRVEVDSQAVCLDLDTKEDYLSLGHTFETCRRKANHS
ncbi:MAG: nucleotidyltransferase family protein [Desulfobacter sp.]|nr:nucleotidyltransferase family protein [Desulfobacter sp.]